ncbi:hypothetical protein PInf_010111 [Phytophthora infestans]|nr:hypothetical protein PInf_010111 [Phytophthora infestans]
MTRPTEAITPTSFGETEENPDTWPLRPGRSDDGAYAQLHIKAALAEKERSAEEARRADIARVHDAQEGKSAEDTTEEQADDAKAAETAGEETMNGSDSSGVSEEDVAQTQVAEEPSERRRQGRKMTVSDIKDEVLTEVPAFKA